MEEKSRGEKYWILIVRGIALIIGFLPFLPNSLYYLGFNDSKETIDTSDVFFVVVGFVMLWGSANFGTWANGLGATIINKIKK